jgi:CBS domain-containing protein
MNVLVGEVMNKDVKTIRPDDSIKKAASVMKKNRIGSVIVMSGKKVVGILTARDMVYKYIATGKGSKAKDIMTKDIITISPKKRLTQAAQLMSEKKIEKLPVFEDKQIVGIITATDIVKVEPALFELLLERMRMGKISHAPDFGFGQCEKCGNYSDDLEEESGEYICSECRD